MSEQTVPRPRVTVYFTEEVLKKLELWAEKETRTVGNLVEHLAIKALQDRESNQECASQESWKKDKEI